MVLAKTDLFSEKLQNDALLYKALGHPARLQILQHLAQTKSCITGDLSEELPLSRTTVKQHLSELKKAGLIQGHIHGNSTNYCLNLETIKAMDKSSRSFFEQLLQNQIQCK